METTDEGLDFRADALVADPAALVLTDSFDLALYVRQG